MLLSYTDKNVTIKSKDLGARNWSFSRNSRNETRWVHKWTAFAENTSRYWLRLQVMARECVGPTEVSALCLVRLTANLPQREKEDEGLMRAARRSAMRHIARARSRAHTSVHVRTQVHVCTPTRAFALRGICIFPSRNAAAKTRAHARPRAERDEVSACLNRRKRGKDTV
jgi:hypothetical protein